MGFVPKLSTKLTTALLIFLFLLLSGCAKVDHIEVYSVEYRNIRYHGTCVCHIRLDANVRIGQDTITCYCSTDTLHYIKKK